MVIFAIKDCAQGNPYHLFFYMIAQFKKFDISGTEIIPYYYAKTDSVLVESALESLPPRFSREYERRSVEPGSEPCEYIEYNVAMIERIEFSDESWIFKYIRSLYEHIWSKCPQIKGKYTYISRSKASVRRITNESQYLDKLKSMNVSVYWMEDLSFVDQIKLFAESEIVTGPHGAAYSFATFCKPGSILYEIYRADNIKGHYPTLANQCNLRYFRYTGIEHYDEATQDMTIDCQTYLDSLEAVILSSISSSSS